MRAAQGAIRIDKENLDVKVKNCSQLFEETLELWASFQENPQVKKIEVTTHDKKLQYDEIKKMMHTLAPVQQFTQLKEGKSLQGKIKEL